ncbi:MAG: flippase [Candidatus Dormibacteraeota bacterium]|nr:flippase [Candidatus Dormibacteraeota bacterium]
MVETTASAGVQARSGSALVRNLTVLAGSQLVTWVVTFVWTLFVPRAVGPYGTGLLTLAASGTGLIAAVVGLGIRPLLVREIAEDRSRTEQLVSLSIVFRLALALPTLLAVLAFANLGSFDEKQRLALYLGYGVAMICLLYEPIQAALQGIEEMRYLAYSDVLTRSGVSAAGIVLVLLGFHAIGLLWASVGTVVLVLALNLYWYRRVFAPSWRVRLAGLNRIVRASLPYWGFALFFTIYLWIDSLMLAAMTSSTVLGWYGMPTRLFQTLMFIPVILSTAYLPRLVVAFKSGHDELARAAQTPLRITLILSLPVAAGMALVADPLVELLYGPQFIGSVPVLGILALTVPPMYLNIMANQVLVAAGRQSAWTKVMILATAVNPILNLFLIRYFQATHHNGAIGAALSLLLTEVLIAGIAVAFVRTSFRPELLGRLARAAVATGGMVAAVLLVRHMGLFVDVAVGAGVFVPLALLLGVLSRAEMRELREQARPVLRRLRPRRG